MAKVIPISNRLPHTKLLGVMTQPQLLVVWRDILYAIKNLEATVSSNSVAEQYFTYLLMTYAYLKREGSNPDTTKISVHYSSSFAYLNAYDRWINVAKLMQLIRDQRICNDGDYGLGQKYVEKLIAKQEKKGNVFNGEYEKETLLKLLNDNSTDKKLNQALINLVISGDLTLGGFLNASKEKV